MIETDSQQASTCRGGSSHVSFHLALGRHTNGRTTLRHMFFVRWCPRVRLLHRPMRFGMCLFAFGFTVVRKCEWIRAVETVVNMCLGRGIQ